MKFDYSFVKNYMKKNNITKYDIVEKCHLDHSVFRTMEKGHPVKLTTLATISKALNVPMDKLVSVSECNIDKIVKNNKRGKHEKSNN